MAATDGRLYLHSGDEYVGSVEPESLQILTLLRLADADNTVNITTSCKFWDSPTRQFPAFLSTGMVISTTEGIADYLMQYHGINLDQYLNKEQCAEVVAFTALLKDRLKPAMLYLHWLDSKNYLELTRTWYSKATVFPLTMILLSWRHRRVQQELMTDQLPSDTTPEQRKIELLNSAEECISLLATRLGEKPFFFGGKISSLDAMVFGYLEIILQYTLPGDNVLQHRLNSCHNLVAFCDQIRSLAFPNMRRKPMVSSVMKIQGPFWKDPIVWACAGVAVTVLVVQGVRVGLFKRMSVWWSDIAARAAAIQTSDNTTNTTVED